METIVLNKTLENIREYKANFIPDGGVMHSDNLTKAAYIQAIGSEMQESILFSYLGTAAMSIREDGIYNYVEKVYDTSVTGDGEQTTEISQPYQFGIAPTERKGMLNPNGDSRYIEHPEISFAADEPWSVTTCLNWDGNSSSAELFGKSGNSEIQFSSLADGKIFVTSSAGTSQSSVSAFFDCVGKNTILTFVVNGDESMLIYKNGAYIETLPSETNLTLFDFVKIMSGRHGSEFSSIYNTHIIRNIALSAEQVANEAAFLQSVYPEIPSITIETYNIATTSLDVVASSDGTTIAMASDNTDWATGLARWRYYSDDSQIGSWGNKLYNKASRDVIILNPPENWHVATEAELTVIATIDGNNLKVEGTDYWSTANGTNHSGLSAVGSGMVNTDGTFTGINTTVGFWCADSDKALIITDAGAATITSVSANEGYCIRLIEN